MAKAEGKVISVIHESNGSQHRIIVIRDNGTNVPGAWAEQREVAYLDGYFAIMGESPLPQGVFTCRSVDHQVLE